jgi:enoyl-CoA hydratase
MLVRNILRLHSKHTLFETKFSGRVGLLRLNRPEARNSVSQDMCRGIQTCIDAFPSETRVLIISGDDTSFSAGKDLKASLEHTPAEAEEYYSSTLKMVRSLLHVPIPVIVAMERVCLGMGLEIALTGDIRIAGESCQIGFPEINLSLFPGCDGAVMLSSLIGNVSVSSDMILTGRKLSAEEARSVGIVSRVVPDGTTLTEALSIAESMSRTSRELLVSTKRVLRHNFNKEVSSEWLSISETERRIASNSTAHKEALAEFSKRGSKN